jgi:uncharacterized protein YbcC (UPF0753/DUF2309 family)
MMKKYQVIFIDKDGERITREVDARHEFEAIQLAGAFGLTVLSVINLDL